VELIKHQKKIILNNYFQFKQFTVQQEFCAMKVCTDACLFGAWVAQQIHQLVPHKPRVLDIGAGTGLLSLMLAQASVEAHIDAVELEPKAAQQATQNFQEAVFKDRLHLIHKNILEFSTALPYDLIISNPPFYENDLKSNQPDKNAAKHADELTLAVLLEKAVQLLSPGGMLALLLPFHRLVEAEERMRELGYYAKKKALVYQTLKHPTPFRAMWVFANTVEQTETKNIWIKNDQQQYTEAFIRLLQPYYLKL
jgi:tRNA1Val (adenine37-N6)-methyltransferase